MEENFIIPYTFKTYARLADAKHLFEIITYLFPNILHESSMNSHDYFQNLQE